MIRIIIKNLQNRILTAQYNNSNSVLNIIQDHYIDWMHSCGGKGLCTTCKMVVIDGMENLTGFTKAEEKYQQLGQLGPEERLTCQVGIKGNIEIFVPDETKLPHITYSD